MRLAKNKKGVGIETLSDNILAIIFLALAVLVVMLAISSGEKGQEEDYNDANTKLTGNKDLITLINQLEINDEDYTGLLKNYLTEEYDEEFYDQTKEFFNETYAATDSWLITAVYDTPKLQKTIEMCNYKTGYETTGKLVLPLEHEGTLTLTLQQGKYYANKRSFFSAKCTSVDAKTKEK